MTQIIGFTRKETMELTGCNSGRLSFLEQIWQIVPYRHEQEGRNSIVLFSWDQLLAIRAIEYLRQENIPSQTVKQILQFLGDTGYDSILDKKQLVVLEDCIFWVEPDWSNFAENIPPAFKVADEENQLVRRYTLFLIPSMAFLFDGTWEADKSSKKIDFQSFQERADRRNRA